MLAMVMKKYNIPYSNDLREPWICITCFSYMKKNKVPPSSYWNKMTLPNQGPLKDLNVLEQLLLAPVLPFFRLHQATVGKQFLVNGNIVLVPSDVKNTVTVLPRLPSNTGTIKAKLKRRLRYKHHVYSMNIRPQKLRESIAFLNKTSKLFQEQNIVLNEDFDEDEIVYGENDLLNSQNSEDNAEGQVNCPRDNADEGSKQSQSQKTSEQVTDDDSDAWSEFDPTDIAMDNPGIQDTMLSSPDFVEPSNK